MLENQRLRKEKHGKKHNNSPGLWLWNMFGSSSSSTKTTPGLDRQQLSAGIITSFYLSSWHANTHTTWQPFSYKISSHSNTPYYIPISTNTLPILTLLSFIAGAITLFETIRDMPGNYSIYCTFQCNNDHDCLSHDVLKPVVLSPKGRKWQTITGHHNTLSF